MAKKIGKIIGKSILVILGVGFVYALTLCFPEFAFKNKMTVGFVAVYSDEEIPVAEMTVILETAESRLQKSVLYKPSTHQRIFIANNPIRWRYFTNINYKTGGINYVPLNHSIFLRKVDVKNNRLYGPSGKISGGDRTLDYYMTHEMTHTLEYQSMPRYKYPFKTNWVLEGYCEYVAHGSQNYETVLDKYLHTPENKGEKYYTRARTMVTYLLEIEQLPVSSLWVMVGEYDAILKRAIPHDAPAMN
ncbi:MAG: hypothetical protein WAV51_03990 [Microgenomates group bacterium]